MAGQVIIFAESQLVWSEDLRRSEMQKWELYILPCGLGFGGNVNDIWSKKDKKSGKTQWDTLTDLAADGWELIDATPITFGGTTSEILYTFKRPVA